MTEKSDLQRLEQEARASLEERYGHPFTDEEWSTVKRRLLDLAHLQRDWQHETGQEKDQ